ncbi:MAG: carboxy-terminal-processing protease, carboxyl-terminal processing protease [Candidatus Parcubacteria bacterium]|jgi:carboxyl-terminal processing protease
MDTQSSFRWPKTVSLTGAKFIIVLVVVAIAAFIGGLGAQQYVFAVSTPVYDERRPDVNIGPLFTAWQLLDENFVPVGTTTVTTTSESQLWGAISGLAQSYGDEYTTFFPPKEKEIFETSVAGAFEGVGMEVGAKDGVLTVIAPLKNTPAYRAGILAGDRILSINGETTEGLVVEEAVKKIRGEKGTKVDFSISRAEKDEGTPFTVSVIRDKIVLPTLDYTTRDGTFVVSLYSFNAQASQLFADSMREFASSGLDKLVIDVRGNPGGYLEVAVDIASWFLPQGETIVSEYGVKAENQHTFESYGYNSIPKGTKIAVIIDKGSASASEILAGALRDHGIATLVGEQSFGKGSVQQLFDVTEKTSLKITIARWFTPNGTSISKSGLTPDIKVDRTAEDRESGKDPQLDRAIQFLKTGK